MSKATRLIELRNLGLNVPDFIVLKNKNDKEKLKIINKDIHYSIRSSANIEDGKIYSFAGIFQTFLNISYKDLYAHIDKCFEDFYVSETFQKYLVYFNIAREDIDMNVIVQEMLDSEISGVAFTHDPITGVEKLIIEAVYGLGVGIVEGKYKPDIIKYYNDEISYSISFQDKMLKCKKRGSGIIEACVPLIKQSMHKLYENKILKIVRVINQLKRYYEFPFEIEWSFCKGKLYLLQLRPITTIKRR